MAEYTYNDLQTVQPGQNVILNGSIPCNKGYVIHREDSGVFILRGVVNNCGCFARYKVTFNGNIAVPDGQTEGAIALAVALNGETLPATTAISTPTATDAYFNVTSTTFITVPRGCCLTVAIKNVPAMDGATELPVNVRNANLTIDRVA